ncbi:uncharacterized protein BDZ99DRAFT_505572 [Mytilinidion resinicola]|uniref:CENP-V/GFA domain-containing protein n=1 Tax=Mytilinidion resinicola TaxID=574789 RepID=A0A6A6Z6V7_9PEZI|nr:uncharacterized protein BDZ99DRAFT_505572 [Mytilinidion resinicola]KAF2815975.1 hypothetical protein BDZ99DRAFT_505572 [Mytilinidion resinicola]
MTTYEGSCLCGQTEWTATLEKDQTEHVLCHCDTCKVLSGGAFTMNQIIPSSAFKLGKGGKPVHCYYCPNCTTHVYHHQTVLGDKYILRTAKMPWEKEVATTFETLPPDM